MSSSGKSKKKPRNYTGQTPYYRSTTGHLPSGQTLEEKLEEEKLEEEKELNEVNEVNEELTPEKQEKLVEGLEPESKEIIKQNIENRKTFTKEQIAIQNTFLIETADYALRKGVDLATKSDPSRFFTTPLIDTDIDKEKHDLIRKYLQGHIFKDLPFPTTGIPVSAPPGEGYQTEQNFSPGLAVRDFMQLVLLRQPRPIISLQEIVDKCFESWNVLNWYGGYTSQNPGILSKNYKDKFPSIPPAYRTNIQKKICRHFDFPDYGSIEQRYFNKTIRPNPNGSPGIDFNLLNPSSQVAKDSVRVRKEIVKGAKRMEYYMKFKDNTFTEEAQDSDIHYDSEGKPDFRNMSYCIICTEKKQSIVTHCFFYIVVYDDDLSTFVTYMAGCGYYGTTEYHDLLNARTYNLLHYGRAAIYTVDEVARLFDKTSKGKPFEYNIIDVVPLLPPIILKLNLFLQKTDSIITQFEPDPLKDVSLIKAAQHNILLRGKDFVYTQCPIIPSSFHTLGAWFNHPMAKGVNCGIFIEVLFNKYISCSILGIAYPKFCRKKGSGNPYSIMQSVIQQLDKLNNTTAADTVLINYLIDVEVSGWTNIFTFGGTKPGKRKWKLTKRQVNRKGTTMQKQMNNRNTKRLYNKMKRGTILEQVLSEQIIHDPHPHPGRVDETLNSCDIRFSSGPKTPKNDIIEKGAVIQHCESCSSTII